MSGHGSGGCRCGAVSSRTERVAVVWFAALALGRRAESHPGVHDALERSRAPLDRTVMVLGSRRPGTRRPAGRERAPMTKRWTALGLLCGLGLLLTGPGCGSDSTGSGGSGGTSGAAGSDGGAGSSGSAGMAGSSGAAGSDGGTFVSPVESIPLDDTITDSSLTGIVDIVRDEHGNPHIYASNPVDLEFAQGFITAHDRLPELDFARHAAAGRIAELGGALSASVVDSDIRMRAWHLEATAQQSFDQLKASTDPADKQLVAMLGAYAKGVNLYIDGVKSKKYTLPKEFGVYYSAANAKPWTEVDSFLLGQYQAFDLSFDANSEIQASDIASKSKLIFDQATDADLLARAGLGADLQILAPVDPTYTISGWTGMNGDTSTAIKPSPFSADIGLLEKDMPSVAGIGNDHWAYPSRGSNNWIIGPGLSATGNTLVANDTHLGLTNPATFYIVHLATRATSKDLNVMGVAFPGIPGVILGMNDHIAWGATVNNIDVTDVYQETVKDCSSGTGKCVVTGGKEVALVPRQESFGIGLQGAVTKTVDVTLYDVPNHGPIIPRVNATHDGIDPLGASELSVKYTGFEPAQLVRFGLGIDTAASVQDAKAAIDRDFKYGDQNWVIGDDQGHFGWTEYVRTPRRAAADAPWMVMPGDGTAEWGADMDPKYIPHAWDPAKNFIATANADPIGVTDDGDPFFSEPVVGAGPLYLGWNYDPGTRVGRITKRIEAFVTGGKKMTLDDLQSIQADAKTEWGEKLEPTLYEAAQALAEEMATPSTHPELQPYLATASADVKAILPSLPALIQGWTFDTPSGAAEDAPTAAEIADSRATLVSAMWQSWFSSDALDDELSAAGIGLGSSFKMKLLVRACTDPTKLSSAISTTTNDPVLFDDLATQGTVESKQMIASKALVEAIDALVTKLGKDATKWRWGQVHTLTLDFFTPVPALAIPPATDPNYPNGFPRHGDNGTVDVGNHGLSKTNFTYASGPAIRFVCELTPNGPKGRNALPGGEIFDPASPHYSDQMELWRKNKTYDYAFQDAEVVASAQTEYQTNQIGRIRLTP